MSRNRKKKKPNPNFEQKQPIVSYQVSKDITKNREPEIKRDSRGNVIYSSQYLGDDKFEYWVDYDVYNRPIKYTNSRGYEWSCLYNSKGNISKFWDNTGYEETYKYYANNLVICTDSFFNRTRKNIDKSRGYITREVFLMSE